MRAATAGLADVRTIRPDAATTIEFAPHEGELVFGFVIDGSAMLEFQRRHEVHAADSLVIPPGESWRLTALTPDFRLLHVTTAQLD